MGPQDINVSNIPKRTITFEVSVAEARDISDWIGDALDAKLTPQGTNLMRLMRDGFVVIADSKEGTR